MDPTEALRRVAVFCGMGTGITGYYPPPSTAPKLPAALVYWTGGQATYRGGEQELLMTGEIRVIVADQNASEKVVAGGDALIATVLDRFRPDRDNPAYALSLDGEPGGVKHVHVGRGGDEPRPFEAGRLIAAVGGQFYGAVFPFEIKLTRQPEQIA